MNLKDVLNNYEALIGKEIMFNGWIKTNRDQKEFGFITLNDGTCFPSIQIVYTDKVVNCDEVRKWRVGSSIEVVGKLVHSERQSPPVEIHACKLVLVGDSPENYPIQPKKHSREFLREVAPFRGRTNLFHAVFRMRSEVAYAVHSFFHERGFMYVHAPIITPNDAEGAGEVFRVTTFDLSKPIPKDDGLVNFKKDFFGKPTFLSVSGQLEAELFALSFKNVYTFGPTFRSENSNTQRHASEFWMIEPEMAFITLQENLDVIEDFVKYVIDYVLRNCSTELDFLNKNVDKDLIEKLRKVRNEPFYRVTHHEAITILRNANVKFENEPTYGSDLATEHDKYLTEIHFKAPVFITDWPKEIKSFYMRLNDDGASVAAVDLLVPGCGELVGGSEREDRLEVLLNRMRELNIDPKTMDWYLDTRRFGGCRHAGFGVGFERLIMYLTGIENIRDVIPFPRTPKNCDF